MVFPFITSATPNPPLPPTPTFPSPPPAAHLGPASISSSSASDTFSEISIDLEKSGAVVVGSESITDSNESQKPHHAILDKVFGPSGQRILGFKRSNFILIVAGITYILLAGIIAIAVIKGIPFKGTPNPQNANTGGADTSSGGIDDNDIWKYVNPSPPYLFPTH